jgi:lysophospholipase L1-like esterase
MPEHLRHIRRARQGDLDLLFLGDSLTTRCETVGRQVWEARYSNGRTAKFAIGSDRIQNVLWRLTDGVLEGFSARVIVLMVGTNNVNINSPEEIADAIREVVAIITEKQLQARVLLLGILPRDSAGDPVRPKIRTVNRKLGQLDDGSRLYFLDFGDRYLDARGNLIGSAYEDRVHLSEQGYQLWEGSMQSVLDELLAMGTMESEHKVGSDPARSTGVSHQRLRVGGVSDHR